jgi:hypothetical protein
MWTRSECAICRTNFGVHPKAKTFLTRGLCTQCRKVPSLKENFGTVKVSDIWTGIKQNRGEK